MAATGFSDNTDITDLLGAVDMNMLISNFNNLDTTVFGLKNSMVYRKEFMNLALSKDLTEEEMLIVLTLSVIIKSKKRILDAARTNPEVFRTTKMSNAIRFIMTNMKQYVSEQVVGFPMVKLPESFPSLSALIFVMLNPNVTPNLIIQNLWAAQLNFNAELMTEQLAWETDFWTVTVTKSLSTSNSYERGFQREYYNTKSSDSYKMVLPNGLEFLPEKEELEKEDLALYIDSVRAMVLL